MCLVFALSCCLFGQISTSEPSAPLGSTSSLQRAFDALKAEQEAERLAFRSADVDHEKDEARRRGLLAKHRAEKKRFTERAMELARSNPQDEKSLDVLIWLIDSYSDSHDQVFEELLRNHISSKRVAKFCKYATSLSDGSADLFLARLRAENMDRDVVGNATYWLAERNRERSNVARQAAKSPKAAAELASEFGPQEWARIEGKTEMGHLALAIELYKETVDKYATSTWTNRFGEEISLGSEAQGKLFSLERLAIGQTAPDIEGNGVEGDHFRLSEYRGKVVVLTFSGNWCGPCVADYPNERALVERWKGQAFVLLSVNTDRERKSLREAIGSGTITWRCWWDGGTGGPITSRWGIDAFPSVFVIDRQGVIRRKDVRRSELDSVVEDLIKEPIR